MILTPDGKSEWNLTSNYFKLDNGQAVRLDPGKVAIYSGSEKVSQFDNNGMGIWREGKEIGFIGTNSWLGKPSVKGLVFDLEYAGGDYMTWAYRTSSTASSYTTMLTVDPKGETGYGRKGIFADLDIYVHGSKGIFTNKIGTRDRTKEMTIESWTVNGSQGIGLINESAGIIITNNEVFIKTNGNLYSFYDWVVKQ